MRSRAILVCLTTIMTSCLSLPQAEIGENLADSAHLFIKCSPALERYEELVKDTVLQEFYLGSDMEIAKAELLPGALTHIDSFDEISCIFYQANTTADGMLCHQNGYQVSHEISARFGDYRIKFEAFGESELVDQITVTRNVDSPTPFDVFARFARSPDNSEELQSCAYLDEDECVYEYIIKEGYAVSDEVPLCPDGQSDEEPYT